MRRKKPVKRSTKAQPVAVDHVSEAAALLRVVEGESALNRLVLCALKLTEVRDLLQAIEWAGDDVHFVCPSCRCDRMHGHDKGCRLRAWLTEKPWKNPAKQGVDTGKAI